MLLFCPSCSNVLTVSQLIPSPTNPIVPPKPSSTNSTPGPSSSSMNVPSSTHEQFEPINRLECQTCPYQYILKKSYYERKTFVRKEREDVFGGPGAWDNADKMKIQCPANGCDGEEAAFYQVQIRSADEPMTGFYKCMTCGNRWREN